MAKHHEISHGFNKQGKALKNPNTMCFNPAIDLLVSKSRMKLLPKLEDFTPSTATALNVLNGFSYMTILYI